LARQISSSSETPRNFSKLYSNPTHRTFPKFSFEFHFKSGQVPLGKDVPCLELLPSIFYLKFLEPARPSFASIKFKLIPNNSNNSKTVLCSRVAHFPSRLGPAHAHSRPRPCSTRAADRPTPPVSDTVARYCAGPPVSPLSPALSPTERACAAHVARPPVGTGPHELPSFRDPPFSSFSLSAALPPSIFFPTARHFVRKPDFSPLSDHSLERLSLSATPRTRTTASGHRSPPLPREFRPTSAAVRLSPGSSSPSFQSLGFLTISSPPRLSRAAGPPQPHRRPPETPHRR
jgi:hypothetical protein